MEAHMKLLGGDWSKGDIIAFVGVVLALVGTIAAILAIPGMPKLVHSDGVESATQSPKHFTNHNKEACMNGDLALASIACGNYARELDLTCGRFNVECGRKAQCWHNKERSLIITRDACIGTLDDKTKANRESCNRWKTQFAVEFQEDCDQ